MKTKTLKFNLQRFASVNPLDTHLANYEVFIDGKRSLGTAEVTLPNFEYMVTTLKGAGVAGELDVPTVAHFSNLELTLKWLAVNAKAFELLPPKGLKLALYGAQQQIDTATGNYQIIQNKIEVTGLPKNLNLGKMTPADVMDTETVISLLTLKETLNKKVILEYDKLNWVFRINGTDYAAELKSALGSI